MTQTGLAGTQDQGGLCLPSLKQGNLLPPPWLCFDLIVYFWLESSMRERKGRRSEAPAVRSGNAPGLSTNKVLPGRGVKNFEFLCIKVCKVWEICDRLVLGGLVMFDREVISFLLHVCARIHAHTHRHRHTHTRVRGAFSYWSQLALWHWGRGWVADDPSGNEEFYSSTLCDCWNQDWGVTDVQNQTRPHHCPGLPKGRQVRLKDSKGHQKSTIFFTTVYYCAPYKGIYGC